MSKKKFADDGSRRTYFVDKTTLKLVWHDSLISSDESNNKEAQSQRDGTTYVHKHWLNSVLVFKVTPDNRSVGS